MKCTQAWSVSSNETRMGFCVCLKIVLRSGCATRWRTSFTKSTALEVGAQCDLIKSLHKEPAGGSNHAHGQSLALVTLCCQPRTSLATVLVLLLHIGVIQCGHKSRLQPEDHEKRTAVRWLDNNSNNSSNVEVRCHCVRTHTHEPRVP